MAHHEALVLQRQASRALASNQATKLGTTNTGFISTSQVANTGVTLPRQTQTLDVAANSHECNPPTRAASAAPVEGICQGSLFLSSLRGPSMCPGILIQSGRPAMRPSSCVPVASSTDQMSFLIPLPCFFRRTLTLFGSFLTNCCSLSHQKKSNQALRCQWKLGVCTILRLPRLRVRVEEVPDGRRNSRVWHGDEFPFEGRRRKCTELCVEKQRNGVKDNLDEKSWDSQLEGRQTCGKIGCERCLELHLLSFTSRRNSRGAATVKRKPKAVLEARMKVVERLLPI